MEELKLESGLKKQDMKTSHLLKVYLDMDGVLADFDKKKLEVFGLAPELDLTSEEWKIIEDYEGGWFSSLDWMSGGELLWDYLQDWDVTLLTGTPRTGRDKSIKSKLLWIERNLGKAESIFCYSREKQKYANPYSILIDDRGRNIAQWIKADGIGILHSKTHETIQCLEELLK